ncbi:MAG TPA: cytochrome P450 [Nostocaceae cyanobacterium]|nr:cytochrome P450 [Nostocaceae cyanobacterium]
MSQPLTTQPNYDLLSPEALINPYPLYKQILSEDPVYFYEKGGFWFLSRYQDVEAAFLDLRLSSDRQLFVANQLQGLDFSMIQNYTRLTADSMLEKDPPVHTKLRKIAQPAFTTKALENWRSVIQSITDDLLDQVEHQHHMDIAADISSKLPSLVIAKIFDIPEESQQDFIQWGIDIGNFWGFSGDGNVREIALQADRSSFNFIALLERLIAEREQQPGHDLISLLIVACKESGINLELLPPMCSLILTAGHQTTSEIISNGVYALLQNPQQWQQLKENPQLINTAVEELIRFDAPIQMLFRFAKEDLLIGGKKIPAGSVVGLGMGAANHDPEKFTNPEILDITRSPNEHLSFGKGIHFCVGVILARIELASFFSTLVKRMPNLSLDSERTPKVKRHNLVFKGFESLPVKF